MTVTATAAIARARAGELLGPAEVAAIFGISRSGYTRFNRLHYFDQFKTRPAIGRRCYSGVLLTRYLDGDPLYVPTFGRKRG